MSRIVAAAAQIAPAKAELRQNLDRIAEIVRQASEADVDLLLFPETATSGYFLEGGVLENALSSNDLARELYSRVGDLPRAMDVALGFYENSSGTLYNSAAYLELGAGPPKVAHTYRKFFLPTYGVFDEERFVSRGRDLGVFDTRFGRVALLICEDVWHSVLPTLCALARATILLVPSASPARGFSGEQPGNLERYARLFTAISEEHGVYCINAMLCGFEGGKGFVGGSMIVDPFGKMLAQGPVQEEHLLRAALDLDLVSIARSNSPLLSDLHSAWGDIQRIVNSP